MNTNIRDDVDYRPKKGKSIAPSASVEVDKNGNSLFNTVLKRRKSRMSTYAPGILDFDYAGDSAKYAHLIEKREDGRPDRGQLNFEMNLRQYKNTTEFNAFKPFLFPGVKSFSPRSQWMPRKQDAKLINEEYKRKFNDKFAQKNANELMH